MIFFSWGNNVNIYKSVNKRAIGSMTGIENVFNQSAVNFLIIFIPNCHNKNTRQFNISDIKFSDFFFKGRKKMKLVEVKHPLVKHKLGVMREADIDTKKFRELATEVGSLLTYEATADLETEKVIIEGWNGPVEIDRIKGKKVTVVPILRAGLGMMDGVLEHVPSARISVVGIYRNEETLEPVPYFQKLASDLEERLAIVVDPMLATGGSMISTIDLLKAKGCQHIKVLVLVAAPEGIKALEKAHPDIELYCASIDDHLNEQGYIIPGLGDAGDKIFGTK